MNRIAIGATLALVIAGAANAFLGGFGVSTTLPDQNDPRTKDAVLVVQPVGCHGPGASVMAHAEGMENGKRRTVDLKLYPLPGKASAGAGEAFMVKREWPANGQWVLVFTAKKEGMRVDSIVKLDRDGKVLVIDNPRDAKATVLPDGKTQLRAWSFVDARKVVAMYTVSGNLKAAVDYTLGVKGL